VQLKQAQADELGDLPDLVLRLVDEDPDGLRPHGKAVDDRLRRLGRNVPR